ncbi:MAG: SHOCT domain-containing protein [Firmicutes bacterium]|nr:SHOCT domain-containing protein [Bacillota bacterium]
MGFIISLIFTLILLAGLGFLIWWIVRQASAGRYGAPGGPPPTSRALEILNERYVKGEISKEEYEEKKRELTAG